MMWNNFLIVLITILCSTYVFAQERAFSSAPTYSLTFDNSANGAEWQQGIAPNLGLAYFDGIVKYINLSTTTDVNGRSFPTFDSSFTIEAWMAYESFNGYSHWFSIGNGPSLDNIYLANTGTGNTVRYGTVSNPFGNSTNRMERILERSNGYSVGVFSHIVATCNLISTADTTSDRAVMLNLYVNGALVVNNTQRNTLAIPRTQAFLGKSVWPDPLFNGWIDSIHIYNYPLSDQSIFGHYVLPRVPVFELAFSEDPKQISGTSATYGFVLADPADVTANVSKWHQGVVTLNGVDQFMDLTVNSGVSTAGTTIPAIGGAGFGTGTNTFAQGWTFEFTFKAPAVTAGAKIFDTATSTGSDRIFLGFDSASALVFSTQFGTGTATPTTVISTVVVGTWYHVIVVVVPTNIATGVATHRVYVNGVSVVNSTTAAYVGTATRSAALIGKSTVSTETTFATLTFDLVRIYDYALSASTVLKLYYTVSQVAPTDPVPPLLPATTAPRNFYNFDQQQSSTGYSTYEFINTTTDGHFGVAAFNGGNSSINFRYFPDSKGGVFQEVIGGGPMTFCIWAKFANLGFWSRLFDFGGVRGIYDNNIVFANQEGTATLSFQVYSGSTSTSVTVARGVQPGKWQYYCAVVDQLSNNFSSPLAANLSIYIDGVLRATSPGYIPPRIARGNLLVARSNWNDARFQGYMDSFSFYEYALDAQQIAAHATTSRPPVFEFSFVRDPRVEPGVIYNFGWIQTEDEIIPANTVYLNPTNTPITYTHNGMLNFNGSGQYVNLTATSGPTSLGTQLPVIGGIGSGIGNYIGWSFEILFKARTRAAWSKIFDFGINTGGDDDIILGFHDNTGNLAFEILNSRVTRTFRYTLIPNLVVDKWYHLVVVVTPLDIPSGGAQWTHYVDGDAKEQTFGGVWPEAISRKNANVGKSNWDDNYFNGTIDNLRIYDYALNENSVRALYRASRSVPEIVLDSPSGHPGPMNSYSFQNAYDQAQSGVANFRWVENLDGHQGVANFDGTNQYINLMGFSDSRNSFYPIITGGTDLSFETWIRYNSFRGYSRVFDISNGESSHNIILANIGNTAQLGFHVYSSYGTTSFNTDYNWVLNRWLHVVATIKRNPANPISAINAANYTIYINGTVVANTTGYYTSSTSRLRNYIGRSAWASDSYLNASMDTFSWYDYALPIDAIQVHALLINPPVFELTFSSDPRTSNISNTFSYGWVDRDPRDPGTSVHQGLLDLTGASASYVDLMKTTGPNSLGLYLRQLGGYTIGVGRTAGWSFEITFLLRNTSNAKNYCKLFDFGNGANPSGESEADDSVMMGLRPNGQFAFQVFNTRFTAASVLTIIPNTAANVWYTVVVVVQSVHVETYRADYTSYVNGVLNATAVAATDFQGLYRENAYFGKSEWGADPNCDGQIDSFRIYDYALSAADVASLATKTVEVAPLPVSSSTGTNVPASSSAAAVASSSAAAVVSSSAAAVVSSSAAAVVSSSAAAVVSSSAAAAVSSSTAATQSSTGSVIVLGCTFNGEIPDGSRIVSVILQKQMNQLPPNYGTLLQNVVLGMVGNVPPSRFGCLKTYDGTGRVAQAEPADATQTKTNFVLLNNGNAGQPTAAELSDQFVTNYGQFDTLLSNALGTSVATVGQPEVSGVDNSGSSGLSDGAIAGIVIGVVIGAILLVILAICLFRGRSSDKSYATKQRDEDQRRDAHIQDHEVETDEVELQHV